MKLRGQPESGYAMVVLLVAMSVMAVMLTVAMPVWNHAARREKEAELVFRGEQYARAIGLFQRKYANTAPPSIDVLVQEKFLRKKFKDPITNADFVPLPAAGGGVLPGAPAQGRGGLPGTLPAQGRGGLPPADARGGPPPMGEPGRPPATGGRGLAPIGPPSAGAPNLPGSSLSGLAGGGGGGVIGVTSSSRAESIRVYKGATRYNEWRFIYTPATATPGAGVPGTATPGAGGRGTQFPGQRGQPPLPGQRGQPPPLRGQPFGGPNQTPGSFGFPGPPTTPVQPAPPVQPVRPPDPGRPN
jgi:type II secretory pathway pseudopilin PulG